MDETILVLVGFITQTSNLILPSILLLKFFINPNQRQIKPNFPLTQNQNSNWPNFSLTQTKLWLTQIFIDPNQNSNQP
jgi:hypothetical protein